MTNITTDNILKFAMKMAERVGFTEEKPYHINAFKGFADEVEEELAITSHTIKNIIRAEIWESHKLSPEFLKKYNIGIDEEKEINELCMKSHNEVLEELIKKIK